MALLVGESFTREWSSEGPGKEERGRKERGKKRGGRREGRRGEEGVERRGRKADEDTS